MMQHFPQVVSVGGLLLPRCLVVAGPSPETDSDMTSGSLVGSSAAGRPRNPTIHRVLNKQARLIGLSSSMYGKHVI